MSVYDGFKLYGIERATGVRSVVLSGGSWFRVAVGYGIDVRGYGGVHTDGVVRGGKGEFGEETGGIDGQRSGLVRGLKEQVDGVLHGYDFAERGVE